MASLTFRALTFADRDAAVAVINSGAHRYREFLPPEDMRDPEMTTSHWGAPAHRITWYGAFVQEKLVGVMGVEYVEDAALLRHAYVLPDYQRQGIGTRLGTYVEAQIHGVGRILAWIYAGNYKARRAVEQAGYTLCPDSAAVLRAYFSVPEDRLRASVAYEKTPCRVDPRARVKLP